MAAFPAIEPIGRRYGLGAHPMATAGFSSLDEVRFLQGATLSGVSMALEFRAISTSEATQIRDHYLGQREHRSFTLPAALWRTHSSQFNVVPAASVWRYAGQPQEAPRFGGLVDVSVPLVSAFDPTVARLVDGGTFAQSPTLSAGALAGYTLVSGGTFTQTPTLAPGTAGLLNTPGPMLSFTSGTSMTWDSTSIGSLGFSFTLSAAGQIKAVGFYDAGGNGLAYSYNIFLISGTPSTLGMALPLTSANDFNIEIPSGTAASLDGVWRKVAFNNGVTLQAGTYGLLAANLDYVSSVDPVIKNASGVTSSSGVTINGPLAYDINDTAISTTGDSPAYFGPVLFF